MRAKLKGLDFFQKGVLLALLAMILVFSALYPIAHARPVFSYRDTTLSVREENGSTLYTGTLGGQSARFVVSPNRVTFHCGEEFYGPYTAREDPTALPQDAALSEYTAGVELRQDGEVVFRGGVLHTEDACRVFDPDGELVAYTNCDGAEMDFTDLSNSTAEPAPSTILMLMARPPLTRRGTGLAWFGATAFCVLDACSVLFADALFRWHLSFRIRDPENAEPSDWEIVSRRIGWVVLALAALWLFILGLK